MAVCLLCPGASTGLHDGLRPCCPRIASPLGIFRLQLDVFLKYSAVVVRNVWLIALAVHLLVSIKTKRATWSPSDGVVGISEFFLSFLSFWTILAQYRSITFRQSLILSIDEVPTSCQTSLIRIYSNQNTREHLESLLWGNTIDLSCILCAAVASAAVIATTTCMLRVASRHRLTMVPYPAGYCWSTNSLVVAWQNTFLIKQQSADGANNACADGILYAS